MPKKPSRFKYGDLVSVALDGKDPAHRLRQAKRTVTQFGIGIVIATDEDNDVCIQWVSAPREFYYSHSNFDVYVSPNRCTKLRGGTDG